MVKLEIFKDIIDNLPWWLVVDFNIARSPRENLVRILELNFNHCEFWN